MTTSTIRLTTAQALVLFLAAQHTERDGQRRRLIAGMWGVFGHGNVAGLGQALAEYGPDTMPFLQGRNEQGMVHAAVGYARATHRASTWACTSSIGPGATNLTTGAALATVNRLPVLLLPGDVFATRRCEPVLQQLELPHAPDVTVNDALRPVSRYFDRIGRPEQLLSSATQAMRVLTDPVETGAVTLALPQDVQAEAYDWPRDFFHDRVWRIRRPPPDHRELADAVTLLRGARRPLLVAGGGVHHSGAEQELRRLVEEFRVPVAETQAGVGSLPGSHPLSLGALGHTGTSAADDAARDADLVVCVGTRLTDFSTASRTLFAHPDVRFLGVNVAPFDAHKLAAAPLVGDARESLTLLHGELAATNGHATGRQADADWLQTCTDRRAAWRRVVERAHRVPNPDARPTQTQLLGMLQAAMADTDVLLNAAGSAPGDLHRTFTPRDPGQYHVEYGYSCMGYEIPAAIGVQLAQPDRAVFALVGDGTYLMLPGEIVTAVQENVPITLLLVQNHGYASIGGLSETVGARRFGTDYRYRDAHGGYTGDPLPVDLAGNAASLGLTVWRAETAGEVVEALTAARFHPGPAAVCLETVADAPGADGAAPDPQAFWDVPVAEVSALAETRAAREEYDRHRGQHRHHLRPSTPEAPADTSRWPDPQNRGGGLAFPRDS